MKNMAYKSLEDSNIKQITNNNNNIINMTYILKNFHDAPNFDDVLNETMTDEEKQMIIDLGPIDGCAKFIDSKCISGVEPGKRSVHCLDAARKKYVIRKLVHW